MLLGSSRGSHIAVTIYISQEKPVGECRITEILNCLVFKIQAQNNVHNFPSPFPNSVTLYKKELFQDRLVCFEVQQSQEGC